MVSCVGRWFGLELTASEDFAEVSLTSCLSSLIKIEIKSCRGSRLNLLFSSTVPELMFPVSFESDKSYASPRFFSLKIIFGCVGG